MFDLYQPIAYTALIFLCLIISFYYRKKDASKLFLYFLLVVIVESLTNIFNVKTNSIYSIGTFGYMIFFTFYYSKHLVNRKKQIYIFGGISCIVGLSLIMISDDIFPIGLGICIAVFYIFLSLAWFFYQTKDSDSIFIVQKQAFWVSVALLFWSIIFLFRVVPMYWLEKNDLNFLLILSEIFKTAVVVTYVFFLVAVTRKH